MVPIGPPVALVPVEAAVAIGGGGAGARGGGGGGGRLPGHVVGEGPLLGRVWGPPLPVLAQPGRAGHGDRGRLGPVRLGPGGGGGGGGGPAAAAVAGGAVVVLTVGTGGRAAAVTAPRSAVP